MISPALPDSQILSAWHGRFPDRIHLWAGQLRLWTVELPIRAQAADHPFAEWVAKSLAIAVATPADVARKLGLPEAVVRVAHRPIRRTFTFLELPLGRHLVAAVPRAAWTSAIAIVAADVPRDVLHPPEVDVIPLGDDWRTVPYVRATTISIVAVRSGDGIDVYVSDPKWNIGPERTWQLPATAIVPELPVVRETELPSDDQWTWLGDGPLREALLLRPQ